MFIKIYPEGPDLQERLKVFESIFNLSLVPITIDNLFWRKKKLIILFFSMIGDKAVDTIKKECFFDLLLFLFDRYLITWYPSS